MGIKTKKLKIFLGALFLALVLFSQASSVFADEACGSDQLQQDPNTKICVSVDSPIQGTSSINGLIIRVINILLAVAAVIAVLYIVIGGYQMMTSAGNADDVKKGRRTVTWALAGLAVIILAFTLVSIVNNVVSNCGGLFSVWFGC